MQPVRVGLEDKMINNQKTVTMQIQEVIEEMCENYCKFKEECSEKIEKDEVITCPFNRLL